MMNMVLFWVVLAILFGILEAMTAGLVSIWFIAGSIIAMIAAALGWHWGVQAVLFLAASVLVLVLLRPLIQKHMKLKIQPTNADALVGKTAQVILPIDNTQGVGQVKVEGSVWSASSEDGSLLDIDTTVVVKEIRGVKLVVMKKEEN